MPTETKSPTVRNTESGGKWVRRIAPIAMLCGGLGAALFAGTRVPRTEVVPPIAEAVAPPEQASPVEVAAKPLTSEYQPSRFPGVMVRAVPETRSAEPKAARWYIRGGGKRQITGSGNIYNPPATTEVTRTTLPGGTVLRRLPPSFKMAEGVVLRNGRLVGSHAPIQTEKGRPAR